MNTLTIDTGTTNACVTVWRDDAALCRAMRQVGVCDTVITDNRTTLQRDVQDTIDAALQKAGFGMSQTDLVLASGTIISNAGLCEVPHLTAPAGLRDLTAGMVQASTPGVHAQLIWSVSDVCNPVDNLGPYNIESMDMMHGEGAGTVGLVSRLGATEPVVIMLLRSYPKFVHLDADQCIIGCVITLTGELLYMIMHNTILVDASDSDFATEVDLETLLSGACSASSIGLGRACFMTRTLGQFMIYRHNVRVNSLLGAVLGVDLLMLKSSSAIRMNLGMQFAITSKSLLRGALAVLVSDDDFFSDKVIATSSERQRHLAGSDTVATARERGLVKVLKMA